MPLMHGKSEKAFKHNVRTEMHHGKPQKQSLAIAYAMKRKSKKAHGGYISGHERDEAERYRELEPEAKRHGMSGSHHFGKEAVDQAVETLEHKMARGEKFAKGGMCQHGSYSCPSCHAKGGEIKGVHQSEWEDDDKHWAGRSEAGEHVRDASGLEADEPEFHERLMRRAKEKHHEVLGEMRGMKKPKLYAHGGMADDDHDLVSRIMKKRGYSEGGRVANEEHWTADFEPNELDVLPHEDSLEFHESGESAGDYDADHHEQEEGSDLVARLMRKRKQHNPRPA